MSHFTVLVIGADPEKQLAPYSESITVPEYQSKVLSEEDKTSMVDYYTKNGQNPDNLDFDELYAIKGDDWNSNSYRKNENGEWAEFSTYNPKSKWDWYQLGGRWNGFFKVKKMPLLPFNLEGFSSAEVNNLIELYRNDNKKFEKIVSKYNGKSAEIRKSIMEMVKSIDNPPLAPHTVGEKSWASGDTKEGWADQLLKRDIDFEGMRFEAENEAREEYNKVLEAFGGVIPKVEILWKTIIDENHPTYSKMDIKEKRLLYHNQDALLKVKEVQEKNNHALGYFFEIEDFQCTLDEFVQKARNKSISTFAVLKDGKWYERGEMGWWAIVTNEKGDWEEEFAKLLDETPDETLLSLYDCHI